MNQLITIEQINTGIDPKYQPFFQVGAATMYRSAFPLIEALWEAIRIFAPLVRLDHPAHVLIGAAPFRIPLANGLLSFEPREGVINVAMENLVFLDVPKMMVYPPEIRRACILEEFVHCFMRVSDEDLASKIVASIYSGIVLENGLYAVARQH